MKQKSSFIAAIAIAWLAQPGNVMANGSRFHKPAQPKKHAAAAHRAPTRAQAPMPCQAVAINPKEDREIVILKLTQRMDCLENKVNYLSEQASLQSHGAVQPFVEQPKEFVIRYPREPENP